MPIDFVNIIRFAMQLSLAVAGAASLWALVFYIKSRIQIDAGDAFRKLSYSTSVLFFIAIIGFFIARLLAALYVFPAEVIAHEGIVVKPDFSELRSGFMLNHSFAIVLLVVAAVHMVFAFRRKLLEKYLGVILASEFVLASIIILFTASTGALDKTQIFHFFHNWHSILTLGTVICVDFLYMFVQKKPELKTALYRTFPIMSAAIWVGLAFDFLSVSLIFDEAVKSGAQFYFNQTVIGILIVNGALLSGKINDILLKSAEDRHGYVIPTRFKYIFGISGSISIVSWLTITFLDFFIVPLPYYGLFAVYLLVILLAFGTQNFIESRTSA